MSKIRTKIRYALLKFPLRGLGGFLFLWGFWGFASAQPVAVVQWNGYTPVSSCDGQFKATEGVVANKGVAVLTRDAAGAGYAVNSDGVATSTGWQDAGVEGNEKYWIATFATTGYENLTLTSKQRGSDTGPADFKIQYKTGSGSWSDLSEGVILVKNDGYVSGVVTDLELPATLSDQPSVSLRWLCTSTTAINSNKYPAVEGGGTNRLDVSVQGTAKSGVIDPKIIVNTNELRFNYQGQQKAITVTGEHLTNPISVTSSNSSMFLPGKGSLPADASEATVNILFMGSVDATGTITFSSGAVTQTVNITAVALPSGNDGTQALPYTVAESQKNQGSSTAYYWVKGYIIGCVESGSSSYKPELQAPFTSGTNILLADNPGENDKMKIVPVQLPAGDVRAALNLAGNPANFGKQVKVEGTLVAYFSMPGMRDARAYSFNMSNIRSNDAAGLTVFVDNGTLFIKNLTEPTKINIYDLTARPVIETTATEIPLTKGIYVVKVGTEAIKVVIN